MKDDKVTGFVWLLLLAYVLSRLPSPGRYRHAGYVHRRTLTATGGAPLHRHDGDPGVGHVALYERIR